MTSDIPIEQAANVIRRLPKNSVTVSHIPLAVKDDLKRKWIKTELTESLLRESRTNDLIVIVARLNKNQTKLLEQC